MERLEEVENIEDNAEAEDTGVVAGENVSNRCARFSEANNSVHTFASRDDAGNTYDG